VKWKGKAREAELDWLSVPLLKGKFLVRIQMFPKIKRKKKERKGGRGRKARVKALKEFLPS
jgi:hypothetical protein